MLMLLTFGILASLAVPVAIWLTLKRRFGSMMIRSLTYVGSASMLLLVAVFAFPADTLTETFTVILVAVFGSAIAIIGGHYNDWIRSLALRALEKRMDTNPQLRAKFLANPILGRVLRQKESNGSSSKSTTKDAGL